MIGKIGKGTNNRINDYNTPYGTNNLEKIVWDCDSDGMALQLEKIILNILSMRGWLLPHQSSGRRAEVIAFKFRSRSMDKMLDEYSSNMQWLQSLVNYYHSLIHQSSWPMICDLVSRANEIINDGSMDIVHRERLCSILLSLGGANLDANLRILFQTPMTLKAKDQSHPHILYLEYKHTTCSIL